MKLKTLLLAGFAAFVFGALCGYAAVNGYQHGKAAAVADARG